MTPDFPTFASACARLGLELSEDRFARLCRYADLLLDWNRRINLISRRDTDRILSYHVIDSLAAAQLIPADARCSDIGTGAGLPGIPLAIARPDISVTLVDSTQKKCQFLRLALKELELDNADVICARSESLEPLGCDVVLSRLTGPLRTTLRHLARHSKPGGSIILYKSPNAAEKPVGPLLTRLGLVEARVLDLTLPVSGIPRRFVVLQRAG